MSESCEPIHDISEPDIVGSGKAKKNFKVKKPRTVTKTSLEINEEPIVIDKNFERVFDKINLDSDYNDVDAHDLVGMQSFDNFRAFLGTFNKFVCEEKLGYILTIEPDECINIIRNVIGCTLHYYDDDRFYFKFNNSVLGIITVREHGIGKCYINVTLYGENADDAVAMWNTLYGVVIPFVLDEEHVNLRWLYEDRHGDVNSHNFQHTYKDVILPEAYPFIKNLDEYVKNFVTGDETLLIFQGVPGTGKTRLVRHLLREMAKYYREASSENCYFGFTNNPELINNEEFYMRFLLDDNYVGMILEDSDVNIKSRKGLGDNKTINKLLFASDGFIPHNKKIILSTNLDVKNIDSAIIRSGRCYDFVQTRELTIPESDTFIKAYSKKFKKDINIRSFIKPVPLCDIYRAIKESKQ